MNLAGLARHAIPAARLVLAAAAGMSTAAGATAAATDGALTGHQIYERVVDNRFSSFSQAAVLVSADRAGREQRSRFDMKWQDFREEVSAHAGRVLSKTLVRYTHPFDLRHAGYLIQLNEGRPSDQFVYYPSRRRVARVSLRSEAVYGTDFSFEDVVPREAQDFHSERLPDAQLLDTEVYVVDLTPKAHVDSEYSRIRVFVDKRRSVVIHARYWDAAFVEIKQLLVPPDEIRDFDGVFVPMRVVMRNLQHRSQTTLEIERVVPNVAFDADTWDLRNLEGH